MTIAFKKVKDAFGWMSNMSPHPLAIEDGNHLKHWRTAEAVFQAMRFDSPSISEAIRECPSPMGAKMIAKRNADKMVVVPRSELDVCNMRMVLLKKFIQHPLLHLALIDTGTEEIVEDVTARASESGLFWGAALRDGKWVGTNTLGKLWMEIRAMRVHR